MPAPYCSTVKSALTELKEILVRSQGNGPSVFAAIASLEATIESIEEKSLAQDDFTTDMGVPVIAGLTQSVVS